MNKVRRGLLYPALHKFYSALNSLEKFEKGQNFFDNISYLDNFFSEYRNITFVLQKSLKHTEYNGVYESLREKYLVNDVCRWFIEKRNEVLKQQPFDLEKRIIITIYSSETTLALPEQIFTVENDVEYSTIIDSLRAVFIKMNPIEIFFSAEFSFYERGQAIELYENFVAGIDSMKKFIHAMKEAINEKCELSDQLEVKIDNFNFYRVPKNMLFIDDYVYYIQDDLFEKGSRAEFTVQPPLRRVPIANLSKMSPSCRAADLFDDFVIMHIVIFQMQGKMMPTCMIVYNDATFNLTSFESSIKTTTYRKFNEIANRIETDGIIKVLFVTEMLLYSNEINNYEELLTMSSKERTRHTSSDLLAFFMLSKDLSFKSYYFESKEIDDMKHVASIMTNPDKGSSGINLFNSILGEFERIGKNE